jgi:hypothetical protein
MVKFDTKPSFQTATKKRQNHQITEVDELAVAEVQSLPVSPPVTGAEVFPPSPVVLGVEVEGSVVVSVAGVAGWAGLDGADAPLPVAPPDTEAGGTTTALLSGLGSDCICTVAYETSGIRPSE